MGFTGHVYQDETSPSILVGDGVTTTTIIGDFVSFTPGQTRSWRYDQNSQVVPGGIRMDSFSATSDPTVLGAR